MTKQIATINAGEDYENPVYSIISSTDYVMYCRRSHSGCGCMFIFDPLDIDNTKALPHVACPSCRKLLQLPARYRIDVALP